MRTSSPFRGGTQEGVSRAPEQDPFVTPHPLPERIYFRALYPRYVCRRQIQGFLLRGFSRHIPMHVHTYTLTSTTGLEAPITTYRVQCPNSKWRQPSVAQFHSVDGFQKRQASETDESYATAAARDSARPPVIPRGGGATEIRIFSPRERVTYAGCPALHSWKIRTRPFPLPTHSISRH